MEQLILFELEKNYYNFMSKFDNKIMQNKNATIGTRPYVGIVLNINNYKYFAPLTSPKVKQKKKIKKHSIDMILIDNGIYGVININNMIPAKYCFLKIKKYKIEKNDSKDEVQYKLLLANQIKWCNKNKTLIKNNAEKVYKIKNNERAKSKHIIYLKDRCCNFKLLEEKCELAFKALMVQVSIKNKQTNTQKPK